MIWKYPQDFKRILYRPGEIVEYVWGEGIFMARIEVSSDVEGSVHDCEQISVMLEGEGEIKIGDEVKRVQKGDAFYIPAGVTHGIRILSTPCVILDCWPCGGPDIP